MHELITDVPRRFKGKRLFKFGEHIGLVFPKIWENTVSWIKAGQKVELELDVDGKTVYIKPCLSPTLEKGDRAKERRVI